ncbi:MAG: ribonucleotide-diphosphate reductase subunit beta [Flavobacteriales bacterium TMED228]|nr:MAG: ribonucleotide-diphosphate reductase subunit beta [Flavobacteriales bacterium TMED228]|tara:strand:- start:5285 stop:6256 length:972 start_codon:yes stop_codon:yes gene_type:complete
MSLLDTRDYYKPFDHPWMFDYYSQQNQMHWFPEDVPLHNDVKDWQTMTDEEKNLLTQIFRLFTQSDVDVSSGYVDRYMKLFKKPEARMMMGAFNNMESIHQHAYSLLLDTVGMPEVEYKAFSEYEAMADKHEYINAVKVAKGDKKSIAKALAIYSAFTEGLQLFSSFIILLNFPRFGKMKGMGQIITYSIRDESMHVEAMTKLFREFMQENIDLWTDDFKKEIYQACREMVDLEDRFLDLVFEQGDIPGLTKKEMQQYIRYIADRRLLQLGLKPNYGVKENPLNWLDDVLGVEHQNFFEGRATTYMKAGLRGDVGKVRFASVG